MGLARGGAGLLSLTGLPSQRLISEFAGEMMGPRGSDCVQQSVTLGSGVVEQGGMGFEQRGVAR